MNEYAHSERDAPGYPVSLNLYDRSVLVVGGGAVATRRIRGLLTAGARVTLVAPHLTDELEHLMREPGFVLHRRAFIPSDLDEVFLALVATDDEPVNANIVAEARARGVLVNDASDSRRGDLLIPLVERIGPISIAIETGGLAPLLAKRLGDEIRATIDERYARAARTLGRLRDYVRRTVPVERRAALLADFAAMPIADLAALPAGAVDDLVDARLSAPNASTPIPSLLCATRASSLALVQSRIVMAGLALAGIASTIIEISTRGDRSQDRDIPDFSGDGIFVSEVEAALREGRADYAVHSCKDMPTQLPEDMCIAALLKREDPRDAFCSEIHASFDALPSGARVGTSSPRRTAMLRLHRPDLEYLPIRGNIDTRLHKLRDGKFEAVVLAMAGLKRLGIRARHTVPFERDILLPAVGQGAIAVECRSTDAELITKLRTTLSDRETELSVAAERGFLRELRGGCQAPVSALAILEDDELLLDAAITNPEGTTILREAIRTRCTSAAEAERVGVTLARSLISQGGATLLGQQNRGPLDGALVLLGRTREKPSLIAEALRAQGAEVVEAFDAAEAKRTLDGRIPKALLFPSSGSVDAIAEYLADLHTQGIRPFVAAMGARSAATAERHGFLPNIIAPSATIADFIQIVTRTLAQDILLK
ncbi:MAG TPA: hydroxymethylbilane synthase [Candidatus Baltobacteraceae bacterium]|nr:hydroxymethylbilane synthase [Candidatus Baltobacteraceae bacterium]